MPLDFKNAPACSKCARTRSFTPSFCSIGVKMELLGPFRKRWRSERTAFPSMPWVRSAAILAAVSSSPAPRASMKACERFFWFFARPTGPGGSGSWGPWCGFDGLEALGCWGGLPSDCPVSVGKRRS